MNTFKRLTAAVAACTAVMAAGYIASATTDPSDPGASSAGSSPSTDSASSAPPASPSTAFNRCEDVLTAPESTSPPVDAKAPTPGGATLTADYEFENSLASSVDGAPDLAETGDIATGYADDTVLGQTRPVLTFSGFTGLSLSPSSEVIESGEYTIELLFRFDRVDGYRKIVDFSQGSADCGLYVLDGRLSFFPIAEAVESPIEGDSYVHVVLTRDQLGTLAGYVNGVQQLTLVDRDLALVDDTLLFFKDDSLTNGEYSSGAVAGIRLYDGPLSADEVSARAAELSAADSEATPVTTDAAAMVSTPVATGSSQRLTPRPAGTTGAPLGYYEYLPADYDDDGSSPLLVFLHGYGEGGDGSAGGLEVLLATGIPQIIGTDGWPAERPFVVLAPQHALRENLPQYAPCDEVFFQGGSCALPLQHDLGHPEDASICFTPSEVHDFLTYAVANYDVDPQRVYLTGLSCGAFGAWEYVAEYGGSQIAAMVPIAGEARPAWETAECGLGEVAIWAFHGDVDDVVAPAGSIEPLANLEGCPQPRRDAELTIYPGVDHDSWTRTYDLSAGHDIYDWLLGFTLSDPAPPATDSVETTIPPTTG